MTSKIERSTNTKHNDEIIFTLNKIKITGRLYKQEAPNIYQ